MIFLFVIFFSFLNSAYAEILCPKESYKVKVPSNYNSTTQIICFAYFDGMSIKHGPEVVIEKDGTIISKKYFSKGKEVPFPHETISKEVIDKKTKIATIFIKNLFSSFIGESQKIKDDEGYFTTKNCQGEIKNWLMLYLMNKSFSEKYTFRKGCDISGSWRPRIDKVFPANFLLQNIAPYEMADMNILITVKKGKLFQIDYFVKNAMLKSKNEQMHFEAHYRFIVDQNQSMAKHRFYPNAHQGEVHFTEISGKKVSIKEKIIVDFL